MNRNVETLYRSFFQGGYIVWRQKRTDDMVKIVLYDDWLDIFEEFMLKPVLMEE